MKHASIMLVASLAACAGEAPDSPGGGQSQTDAATQADAAVTADGATADTPTTTFSFFITSTGNPKGGDFRAAVGDLDGLAGADAFCTSLAVAAVPLASTRTWRAYLSTDTVNARDRIGAGPWLNVAGVVVATDLTNLHDPVANNVKGLTAIDEKGAVVPDNQHDIITGSLATGMAAVGNNCANWTSSAATGVTTAVGHHNRNGGGADATSWVSAHSSGGCSAAAFVATGGRGSLFCFAL